MGQMKTPGVYIVEKNAFPNSVVEVATAVPAFIGYTEKTDNKGRSLLNKPWRITSMSEYHNYFGFGPRPLFNINEKAADVTEEAAFSVVDKEYLLKQEQGRYLLYYSMLLFYQNGGGPCYIVSVGKYDAAVEGDKLRKGIDQLIKEQEPTMVVVPEAVLLDQENCISVAQAALAHCGGKMRSRVAILDVWNGYKERQDPAGDCIAEFRNRLGINNLDFASAYYPWVNTTITQDKDLSYENISNQDLLQTCLRAELKLPETPDETMPVKTVQQIEAVNNITSDWAGVEEDEIAINKVLLNKSLIAMSPLFNAIMTEIKNMLNLLPPAAAMAGVYTMVDNSRGVWKAPANVSLSAVVSPAVNITHDDQEDLNVTTQGKSINAIRTFIGEGTLVWGARTLDGNSLDWRYINVRRTMIMLEESIRLATKAYVFESNDANTWVTIKSMIRNFLTGIWKRGGLAGASPDDAFSVHVGLGETMTSEDILEGILRVTVLVAISRPAEFIEITFQQQMQKS
ncbi:MAG: phage tail sheath C-terminal domain-containing protein [Pseudomonadota bacterium]